MRGTALSAVVDSTLVAGIGLAEEAQRGGKGNAMKYERLKHGFRHDPLNWIRGSKSVPAGQVRTFLLKIPASDDSLGPRPEGDAGRHPGR